MRLFIAINFNDEIKDTLIKAIGTLKIHCVKGNFTHRENLHLTLVFIGETNRADDIKKVLDGIDIETFDLSIGGFGSFRREGGEICWIGVQKSGELTNLYEKLSTKLGNAGFAIEKREYKPHLTLGREVILEKSFDRAGFERTLPQIRMKVSEIFLMKSERIGGKLIYTEVYGKNL